MSLKFLTTHWFWFYLWWRVTLAGVVWQKIVIIFHWIILTRYMPSNENTNQFNTIPWKGFYFSMRTESSDLQKYYLSWVFLNISCQKCIEHITTLKNKVENVGDGITKGTPISKTHHFQATTSTTTSTIVIKGYFIYIIKKSVLVPI